MRNKYFIAAALSLLPLTAIADVYECTTTNFGRGGWISEKVFLEFDPKTGKAKALDAAINEVFKKAIPVEFSVRSETSYTFRWTVTGVSSRNTEAGKISYKVTLFTKRNKFTVSGRLHGYDNVISASGKCVRK